MAAAHGNDPSPVQMPHARIQRYAFACGGARRARRSDLRAGVDMQYDMAKPTNHTHCWHVYRGAIWMVLPDGHVLEKCCLCPATRTVHVEHLLPLRGFPHRASTYRCECRGEVHEPASEVRRI